MSEEAPRKKDDGGGSPAWMGTFADLMSLLMCFFVLLLSFSEMDVEKFKQIAASMKFAFGVQREVPAEEIPKGTSVIAQEYSAGKPTPTVVDEVRQQTTDETKQTIEFTDALVNEVDAQDIRDSDAGGNAQDDQVNEQTQADAEKLKQALHDEIKQGMIQIESDGATIVIRIREKGSFASGMAKFRPEFVAVLEKLHDQLSEMDGRIVVAGHTDNIPIKTARFRSNWDLSSARAVSVVHRLLRKGKLSYDRFMVEGHADARPLVPNDSAENRAVNRRVELTIIQGEEAEPKPFATLGLDENVSDDTAAEIAADAAEQLDNQEAQEQAPESPLEPPQG